MATREAESNRSGLWKGLLGVLWFFGAFAVQSLSELRVVRRVGPAAYTSTEGRAAAARRRLVWLGGGLLLPMVVAIGLWQAHDESVIPVVLGLVLSLGVLGGMVAYSPSRSASRWP